MRDSTVLGLTVFFTGGHPFRFPDSLTRLLSRFPAAHCMVGDRRGVFDPSYRDEGVRRYDAVLEKYPWLLTAVVVPCPRPINPIDWPTNPKTKTWLVPASLARFYSGGRLPRVNNCVDRGGFLTGDQPGRGVGFVLRTVPLKACGDLVGVGPLGDSEPERAEAVVDEAHLRFLRNARMSDATERLPDRHRYSLGFATVSGLTSTSSYRSSIHAATASN